MSPYPLPFPWLLIAGLTVWNTVDYCWYNRQQNLALYLKVYKGKKRMSALTGAIVLNEIYAFRQVLSLIAKKKKKKKRRSGLLSNIFFFFGSLCCYLRGFPGLQKKALKWHHEFQFHQEREELGAAHAYCYQTELPGWQGTELQYSQTFLSADVQ